MRGKSKNQYPRVGWFVSVSNKYDPEKGWAGPPVKATVIAEDKHSYITEYSDSGTGHGYHKSRLIRWENQQLELFQTVK